MRATVCWSGILGLVGALFACSDETGVLIDWAVDPELSTEAELLEQVVQLEIRFTATGGFSGLAGDQTAADGFSTVDFDRDGDAELIWLVAVDEATTLPTLRLDPGHNRDAEVGISVRGLDSHGLVAAYGGLEPHRLFTADRLTRVVVPLNLARAFRPAAVVAVTPVAVPPRARLSGVAFLASRPLAPETIVGHVRMRIIDPTQNELPVTIRGPAVCPFGLEMWRVEPNNCHCAPGMTVQLEIDSSVTDRHGEPLCPSEGATGCVLTRQFATLSCLGSCADVPPADRCDRSDPELFWRSDFRCDWASGVFEPAPCTVASGGCAAGAVAEWVWAADGASCVAFRDDTVWAQGGCAIARPWWCGDNDDCVDHGSGICDPVSNRCDPVACDTACSNPDWACAAGDGCWPKLTACAEDCGRFGGCPEFDQHCTLRDDGAQVCR